jgi:uncharacterized damage-inducible protein DinB
MTSELEHYRQAFERLHADAAAAAAGLPPEALNWRPLPAGGDESTNSLAMTLAHLAGSERFWVGEVAGDRPAHRDRDAEFRATANSVEELTGQLDQALAVTRETLAGLTAEKLDEVVHTVSPMGQRDVTRRWAVLHSLAHGNIHVGHMQLTRQLWLSRAGQG